MATGNPEPNPADAQELAKIDKKRADGEELTATDRHNEPIAQGFVAKAEERLGPLDPTFNASPYDACQTDFRKMKIEQTIFERTMVVNNLQAEMRSKQKAKAKTNKADQAQAVKARVVEKVQQKAEADAAKRKRQCPAEGQQDVPPSKKQAVERHPPPSQDSSFADPAPGSGATATKPSRATRTSPPGIGDTRSLWDMWPGLKKSQ